MFYPGNEGGEEDVDFNVTSTSSTKLANLFSFESPKEQSLTYTAPKQPKKPEEQKSGGGSASSAAVLCAIVVHAYKFENQQYASQGKLGAAIIANHEALSYKLILYKGKQQHVTFATINLAFSLKVQANKYASFYDDQRESWSILFDTEQNSVEFSKQIALAKANSSGSNLNSVVVQDLVFGDEGHGLQLGDSVEVKYTGWLLQNRTIGQLFDSNNGSEKLMKIKLGRTKIIKGWEDGMLGAKKNQRRLLVIPPALGYGNQEIPDQIPPNSTLVFEFCVKKIKSVKDSSRSATPNSSQEKHDKESEPRISSSSSVSLDDSVKARGASISEQLSQPSPKTEKAKIISRMAKMGMPMLPMQGSPIVHQSSESETEDDLVKRRSSTSSPSSLRESSPKPIIKPRPINSSFTSHSEMHTAHQVIPPTTVPQHQLALFQQQYPNPGGMPFAYQFQPQQPMAAMFTHAATLPPQPSLNDTHLPILMSENRAQNSEVRMVLSKIGDKVDMVLNKLDQVKTTAVTNQPMLPYMDSTSLLQNIERIVQENTKWKNDLEEKNQKIHTLNEKICVLLEKNQKLVEESNYIMEKRSDTFQNSSVQSQSRLVTLETEKLKISEELAAALSQISDLKISLAKRQSEEQSKLENLTDNSEKYQGRLETLHKELGDKNVLLRQLEESLTAAETTKRYLTSKLDDLERQFKTAQSSNESLSKILEKTNEELMKKQAETEEEISSLKTKYGEEILILKEKISNETNKPEDNDGALSRCREEKTRLEKHLTSSKEEIRNLEAQKAALELKLISRNDIPTPVTSTSENRVILLVKRAMTALYRSLQQEIESGNSYEGEEVKQLILQSIRTVTIAFIENETTQEDNVQTQNAEETVEKDETKRTSNEENASVNSEIPNEEESENKDKLNRKDSPKPEVEGNKGEVEEMSSLKNVSTEPKKSFPAADVPKPSPKIESTWRPQPPPPPLFDDDDEDEDDWLKN